MSNPNDLACHLDFLQLVETIMPGEQYNRIICMLVVSGRRIGPAIMLDGKVYHPTPEQIDVYVW
jgi:hypothetical protein